MQKLSANEVVMKKIKENPPRICWLCGANGSCDPLDKHHIFGGANRKLSEKYGLYVYLCHSKCHIFGKNAVHVNEETSQVLHEYGQRKAMFENGWSIDDFRTIFGRNYLDEAPVVPCPAKPFFMDIEEYNNDVIH